MKRFFLSFSLVLAISGCVETDPESILAGGFVTPVEVVDWRDEIIYQVLVDRFDNGDVNNDYNVDRRAMARYHGGDWQGLIDRMDYLEELGITTLWISPVVKNVEEDAGFASYHGYWTQDFLAVNPHFGNLTDLRRLVDAAHRRNIKVILDVVTNHVGQLFFYDINGNGGPDDTLMGSGMSSPLARITEWDPDYDSRGIQGWTSLGESGPAPIVWVDMPGINRQAPRPAEFHNDLWYHRRGRVTVWGREQAACDERGLTGSAYQDGTPCYNYIREQEVFGDFPGGLKDLATERDDVTDALIAVFKYWVRVADFDGFRIDTVKHVDYPFWKKFNKAIRDYAVDELGKKNFFIFGEAFTGIDWLLASYTGGDMFDGVFYFSQKFQVFDDVFKRGNPTAQVESLLNARLNGVDGHPGYAAAGNANGPEDENGNLIAPRSLLVNFMDNHDVPRFLYDVYQTKSRDAALAALHSALVYLLTWDGIPCLYYGTEQQFSGGNDPNNREDMFEPANMPARADGGRYPLFNTDNPTFLRIRTLIQLRKTYPALRRGAAAIRWVSNANANDANPGNPDRGILAFERAHAGQLAVVVINTSDSLTSSTHSAGNAPMPTGFAQGTRVKNVYCEDHVCTDAEAQTFTAGANGTLDVTVGPRQAMILVPAQ